MLRVRGKTQFYSIRKNCTMCPFGCTFIIYLIKPSLSMSQIYLGGAFTTCIYYHQVPVPILRYLNITSFFWSDVCSKYTIEVSNTGFCILFCRIKCWQYFRHSNEIKKQTISYFVQLIIVLYINYIRNSIRNIQKGASQWLNYFSVTL